VIGYVAIIHVKYSGAVHAVAAYVQVRYHLCVRGQTSHIQTNCQFALTLLDCLCRRKSSSALFLKLLVKHGAAATTAAAAAAAAVRGMVTVGGSREMVHGATVDACNAGNYRL
jgi:hypothetical protein